MNNNVKKLKEWFDTLPRSDKEEVLQFLYGKMLYRRGMYVGPAPNVVDINEGLYAGPVPSNSPDVCPSCQRPY